MKKLFFSRTSRGSLYFSIDCKKITFGINEINYKTKSNNLLINLGRNIELSVLLIY